MSRTIRVTNGEGVADYVVVEPSMGRGGASFFLSDGEKLVLESANRFESTNGEDTYYVTSDEDIEWLLAQ